MATKTPIPPARSRKTTQQTGWRANNQRNKRNVRFVQAENQSRWQRLRSRVFRFLTHPAFYLPIILLTIGTVLTLGYFWIEFSKRVDLLLNGEVFTQSAGIYSAPKTLRANSQASANDLVAYLKSANYVEKNVKASAARGRFAVDNNQLIIEPGTDATVDGKLAFQPLRVKFNKDGKTIASITNSSTGENLSAAQLEPKLLSSVLNEDRGRRKVVNFNDLPPNLVKAITTTEDRAFFEHYGVNIRGIARALWRRVDNEDDNSPIARQGGSSITQQLVKNLLLTNEKSLTRKLQEAYMSIILETRLSKQEIFTLYANQIYLGQQASFSINGVGEAANAYFGKDVSALNLAESAFLAGIIRSPNRYNPYKNPGRVTERRNQVLDSMLEAKVISQAEANQAKAQTLNLQPPQKRQELVDTPYFTEHAQADLSKIVSDPEAIQHLRVYTTLDPDLQRSAYEAVNKRLEKLDKVFKGKAQASGLQAALVALRPKTGEIVAMIGGRDYLENQFNRATVAERQPGSVFKPFVYAAAINTAYDPTPRVMTAATVFKDEAKVFTYGNEAYKPNNYGDTFSNKELTLRDALVKSKNVITVDLAMQLNVGKVMNLAAKAGLPKVPKAYPSMALGTAEVTPLQMASAYTMFANLGTRTSPVSINRITTGDGATVAAPITQKTEVLRPDVAYVMDDIMKDVVNRGTAAELRAWGFKNVPNKTGFAGKTGTSRDGWFAGFTPDLVCVVYVGFDDGSDLGLKGSDSAMPIWADFMKDALELHPEWNGDWQMPAGIEKVEIDTRTGEVIPKSETNDNTSAQTAPAASTSSSRLPESDLAPGDPDGYAPGDPDAALTSNLDSNDVASGVVPTEFRRTELFLAGTVPVKITNSDSTAQDLEYFPEQPDDSENAPGDNSPSRYPSDQIYIEPDNPMRQGSSSQTGVPRPQQQTVLLQICPETNLIAVPSCPYPHLKSFKLGQEPKQFCKSENHQSRITSRSHSP